MERIATRNNHREVFHTAAEMRDLVDLAEWAETLLNRHVTVMEAAAWRQMLGAQAEPAFIDTAKYLGIRGA